MKVFISYSTKDKDLAERVFTDMLAAGAEVFQYSKTAEAGKPSWTQVLSWIKASDVFIVLVSQNALSSGPVGEEIEHALYWHVNSDRKKPERLISALIERNVQPPDPIAPYSRIDFFSYESDIRALMGQLGLKRPSAVPAAIKPLPDFSELWSEHKKGNPQPSPESQWSAKAAKIVGNYSRLAPPEISANERIDHIDSILTEYAGKTDKSSLSPKLGKYNGLLLAKNPYLRGHASLPESLLNFSFQPLEAPKLSTSVTGLEWSEVAGATTYVVEYSWDQSFEGTTKEIYRGPDRQCGASLVGYYRVKTTAAFRLDSAWSNSVSWFELSKKTLSLVEAVLRPPSVRATVLRKQNILGLEPPLLTLDGLVLSWTEVAGADGYVLERSEDPLFAKSEQIYKGTDKTYTSSFSLSLLAQYYRVKANAGIGYMLDSDWSNTVRYPFFGFRLSAPGGAR